MPLLPNGKSATGDIRGHMLSLGSRVVQLSKALHLSARGVTTDTLVSIQAVSQPAMIVSLIGRCTIGLRVSGVGRYYK